jgi:RHS repeat-associated protein
VDEHDDSLSPEETEDSLDSAEGEEGAEAPDDESGERVRMAMPQGTSVSAVTPQALALPNSGGTLEGMGESFQPLLSSGQVKLSIPFGFPKDRAGRGPALALTYTSGSGNGLVGFGWSLGTSFIARQTDRGLPRYDPNSLDRFVYNGNQELVPIAGLRGDGSMPEGEAWPSVLIESGYGWTYFRVRIEGNFLRFFLRSDERQWVVQDTNGTLHLYGQHDADERTSSSVMDFDVGGRRAFYKWNLTSSVDRSGNRIEYRYFRDGGRSYLEHIYWNNPLSSDSGTHVAMPAGLEDSAGLARYQHHVRLRYEARDDVSSSYASGFRVETGWRVAQVIVSSVPFGQPPGSFRHVVRRYVLGYDPGSVLSLLTSVQLVGQRCLSSDAPGCSVEEGGSLPAIRFDYTGPSEGYLTEGYGYLNDQVEHATTSPKYTVYNNFADLFDANYDGLPDVLLTDGIRYGGGHGLYVSQVDSHGSLSFTLADNITCRKTWPWRSCEYVGSDFRLYNTNIRPLDFDGDGRVEFLHMPSYRPYRYYRMAHDGDDPFAGYWWAEHGPFDRLDGNIDLTGDSANVRAVDVNNDHFVDVVRTAGNQIETYLSLAGCPQGEGKFGTPEYGPWGTCVGFTTEPIRSCALHRGLPLDFSNERLRIADMNGDGVQDIVEVDRGRIAYWPGRGPGVWGEGDRECEPRTFAHDREVLMEDSPCFNIWNRWLYLGDVNGDGTSDIVEVHMHSVEVFLNENGTRWSRGYEIEDTPWQMTTVDDDIRIADMNGSGTPDILWGKSEAYSYLDLNGGRTPRLLKSIENGLGARTEISYATSTEYMARAREAGRPWATVTPKPLTVVSRTVVSDRFGTRQETEYEYRDPVYDNQEAEFRGFRQALVRSLGDDSTPTAVSVSSFHTGTRPAWLCDPAEGEQACRLLDNPYEALKGAAYLGETRTDTASPRANPWDHQWATYLETKHTTYTVDRLYQGLDGRGVWFAWPSQSDAFRYGTDEVQSGGATQELPNLVVRDALPGAPGSEVFSQNSAVLVRASGEQVVHLRSESTVDRFGRTLTEHNDGIVGYAGDEVTSHQRWAYNPANWIHRPCQSWTVGRDSDADERLGFTQTFYEGYENELCRVGDRGLPTYARVRLRSRLPDGSRGRWRWVPQQVTSYNQQGLVQETWGGVSPHRRAHALRHSRRFYDEQYGAYVVAESTQANRADQPRADLSASATWDTGLGVVTSVTDYNGQRSHIVYDRLGRQSALYRPLCQEPSVVYSYQLWPGGTQPRAYPYPPKTRLHHVRTLTNEVCDRPGTPAAPERYHDPWIDLDTSTGVIEAFALVDGLGRVRGTLEQGDPSDGMDWILSGVQDFDARGNVRRSYQPVPLDDREDLIGSLDLANIGALFEEAGYDAFGRTTWTRHVDGSDASAAAYGARYTHSFDSNDLDGSSPHHGTPSTTVYDGLGRVVAGLERLVGSAGMSGLAQSIGYDPLGNVVFNSRGRGTLSLEGSVSFRAGQSTTRHLLYDSIGQRTHTLNPDSGTFLYFYDALGNLVRTIDARGVENRYLYDLGGRLIAEDLASDGANWAVTDPITAQNADDNAGLSRLADLTAQLFAYEFDADNDFLPERGADVLYGNDVAYDGASNTCRAAPTAEQTFLAGRASWVRDPSGCSWSSYDERGRTTWSARQIDPGQQLFEGTVSYVGPAGPDDSDRVRSQTFPDGTSAHYDYSRRGLLESITGEAPDAESLFSGRIFADNIRHDEFGQRVSWLLGDASGNQVQTAYQYDARRRLESMTSQLSSTGGTDRVLARTRYGYDQMANIMRWEDCRTGAETGDWAPEPVRYGYKYDALYRLTLAAPTYQSTPCPAIVDTSPPALDPPSPSNGRSGVQEWTHDALGSMRTWTAVEPTPGEHFYQWSLGTIVNGQQLIAAGSATGLSPRCAMVPDAARRASGPAPHALYFAYQARGLDGEFNGLEACYDAAGNMVALYRLELGDCAAEPLSEASADWNCGSQTVVWEQQFLWDAVGRLSRVEKLGAEGVTDIRHVYDATDTRVVRLDHESTEGSEQATLYVSPSFEIRDAAIDVDGSYFGGEETKYILTGEQRIARVVEQVADGVAEWPNAPGRAYVFHTLTNHLGSASVTFDAEATWDRDPVVVAQTQLPYGMEDARVENPDYGNWKPDYEFTGKEQDPDVGLMYFGARFYAPGLGRWTAADPLETHSLGQADANLYRYVKATVVVARDPNGEKRTRRGTARTEGVVPTLPNGRVDPDYASTRSDPVRRIQVENIRRSDRRAIYRYRNGLGKRPRSSINADRIEVDPRFRRQEMEARAEARREAARAQERSTADSGGGKQAPVPTYRPASASGTSTATGQRADRAAARANKTAPVDIGSPTPGEGYRVSPARRAHILEGDPVHPGAPRGHGHGPGRGHTTGAFPETWTDSQVIASVERVANSPNSTWMLTRGPGSGTISRGGPAPGAATETNGGAPVRYTVRGRDHSITVEVVIEPAGEGIITGYNKGP